MPNWNHCKKHSTPSKPNKVFDPSHDAISAIFRFFLYSINRRVKRTTYAFMSDLNPSTSSSNDRSLRSSKPKSAKGAENKPSVVPCDADMIPSTSHQSHVESDNSNNRREDFESLLLHTNELTKTLQQHFVSKNDDRPSEGAVMLYFTVKF